MDRTFGMTIELGVVVGSGMQLATITIDPAQIRGTGGALSPAIEVPCRGVVPTPPTNATIGIDRVRLQL
jgi:hypothetical protein